MPAQNAWEIKYRSAQNIAAGSIKQAVQKPGENEIKEPAKEVIRKPVKMVTRKPVIKKVERPEKPAAKPASTAEASNETWTKVQTKKKVVERKDSTVADRKLEDDKTVKANASRMSPCTPDTETIANNATGFAVLANISELLVISSLSGGRPSIYIHPPHPSVPLCFPSTSSQTHPSP
jgi:outer membrane biosynthesis protein TonB